ncbi:MAG: isopeptide-forming domain-containing fimbrial protein, partial [Paracoccaceae bacterium]
VRVTFDAVVTDAAEFSGTVDNTAVLTRYDTDPAGNGDDADDGRVFDATTPDYTPPSDDASVATPDLSLAKDYTSSSDAGTSDTLQLVGIGETVTYTLTITIPEGSGDLTLVDSLPAGMEAISAEVLTLGTGGNVTTDNLAADDTQTDASLIIAPDGSSVTFDFGTVVVAGSNDAAAADETITVSVTARVRHDAGNVDTTVLENTATLSIADPVTGDPLQPDQTATESVTVVTPALTIDKDSQVAANPGEVISYTITIANTGTGPAYDILVEDLMTEAALTLAGTPDPQPSAFAPPAYPAPAFAIDGAPISPGAVPAGDGGFRAIVPALLPGETLTVTFDVKLDDDADEARTYLNTATADFDSVPDGNPNTPGAFDGDIEDTSGVATVPYVFKTATGSEFAQTGAAQGDQDVLDLNVGEEVTYTFEIYIPEIELDSVILTDLLPAGLQYVAGSAQFVDAGTGIVNADTGAALSAADLTVTATGQQVEFDFGRVDNAFDQTIGLDDRIRVQLTALVLDVPGTTDAGDTLINEATIAVDPTQPGSLDPATVTETVEVVDPALSIDKTGPLAAEAGDVITYTIVVENTGSGPAFDVVVTDLLTDPGLQLVPGSVAIVGGTATATTPSGAGFVSDFAVVLPGQSITITYDATVLTMPPPGGFDNTAAATFSSAPVADGDGRAGAVDDDHTVAGPPQIDKAIRETSIAATAGAELVVGEEVTYALTVTLPEIPTDSLVVTDTLPPGLTYVSSQLESSGVPGAAPTTTVLGQLVTFDFGGLDNPSDGGIGNDDRIVLLVTARVDDVLANEDGRTLTNRATIDLTPEGEDPFTQVADTVDVRLVEPDVSLIKSGQIGVDQGGTAAYSVVMENTGTGPAADLLLSDAMDPGGFLTYDAGSLTATLFPSAGGSQDITAALTVVPNGQGFSVLVDALAAGDRIEFAYSATLDSDAPDANAFVNTASVDYDTVPDGDPETPTGRQGDASDDHSVSTNPALQKDATATSLDDTGSEQGDGALFDLNVGEEVTYTLAFALPEIAMDAVILVDTLPAGLEFVSAQVLDLGGVVPAGTPSIVNAGQVTTFDFGAVVNPSDGSIDPDDVVTVEIVARVANVPGNAAIVTLTNTATLDIQPEGEGFLEQRSDTASVEVVEPSLTLDKSAPLAANPGDTVPYRLQIANDGTGAAYDVAIADALSDPDIALNPGTVVVTIDGVPQPGVVTEVGTGFTVALPVLRAGEVAVVTYDATLSADVAPARSTPNDATVAFDNVPGAPDSPFARPGGASDDARVATIPALDKTIVATSNPDTGEAAHRADAPDLGIGERVTYELALTLPEIPMGSVVLVDALPEGLEFVSFEVASVGTGLGAVAPDLSQADGTLTFDFGAIDNPFDGSVGEDDRIVLRVTAQVADVDAAFDGAALTNTASLTVTPEGQGPLQTQTDTATLDVVEPELVIDKSVSDPQPLVGDTVTYTLGLSNDGTGPSYDLVIDDPLPFQLSSTGAVSLSDPSLGRIVSGGAEGDTRIVIEIDRLLPGQSVTVVYDVFVGFETLVLDDLPNTATVTGSSSPDADVPVRVSQTGDVAVVNVDPIPEDERRAERFPNLGIDDAQFLPVLTIDPIYSGTAEPGSNVTVTLYRADGTPDQARHILADAGGHWIARFPSVTLEDASDQGFERLSDRSRVFHGGERFSDEGASRGLSFADDARRVVTGVDIAQEAYDLRLSTDRSTMLPLDAPMHNARVFYANAQHQMPFLKADVLRIDEVFENIAADTVDRLYESSRNPLGHGLNRFNFEFLTEATASPGSIR